MLSVVLAACDHEVGDMGSRAAGGSPKVVVGAQPTGSFAPSLVPVSPHAGGGAGPAGSLAPSLVPVSPHAGGGAGPAGSLAPSLVPVSWNNWSECYAGFSPRAEPSLDAFRLGLLCGPSNGLVRLSAGSEPRWSVEVRRSDCLRFVVVAEARADDILVMLEEPLGVRLVHDVPPSRFRVVPPSGPWCTPRPGRVEVTVHTRPPGLRVAVETWLLGELRSMVPAHEW